MPLFNSLSLRANEIVWHSFDTTKNSFLFWLYNLFILCAYQGTSMLRCSFVYPDIFRLLSSCSLPQRSCHVAEMCFVSYFKKGLVACLLSPCCLTSSWRQHHRCGAMCKPSHPDFRLPFLQGQWTGMRELRGWSRMLSSRSCWTAGGVIVLSSQTGQPNLCGNSWKDTSQQYHLTLLTKTAGSQQSNHVRVKKRNTLKYFTVN